MKFSRLLFSALLLTISLSQAQAAYLGSLTYTQPTGTVSSTDTIDVGVKFSLDANSDPILSNSGVIFSVVFFCSGDGFSGGCNTGGPYSFNFDNGPNGFNKLNDTLALGDINPGDSFEFNFLTFTPPVGGVPAGTYNLFSVLGVFDATNDPFYLNPIALTTDQVFTRTVSAVPVPAAAWLFASGLPLMGAIARRRKLQA